MVLLHEVDEIGSAYLDAPLALHIAERAVAELGQYVTSGEPPVNGLGAAVHELRELGYWNPSVAFPLL